MLIVATQAELLQLDDEKQKQKEKHKEKKKTDTSAGGDEIEPADNTEQDEDEQKGLYDYVPEIAKEDEDVLNKLLKEANQRKQELAAAGIFDDSNADLLLRVRITAPDLQN